MGGGAGALSGEIGPGGVAGGLEQGSWGPGGCLRARGAGAGREAGARGAGAWGWSLGGVFLVIGDTIGLRPLRCRCPKTRIHRPRVFLGHYR